VDKVFIFLGKMPSVEWPGHMVTPCLIIEELPFCVPEQLNRLTFPPPDLRGSGIEPTSPALAGGFFTT